MVQYSVFVKFLAKVLYCPKITYLLRAWDLAGSETGKVVFLGGDSTALLRKKEWFFVVQYSVFVKFLAKVLYCPQKKQSFEVLGPRGLRDWKRLLFLVFVGQYSTFAKKRLIFLDSTTFLLVVFEKRDAVRMPNLCS